MFTKKKSRAQNTLDSKDSKKRTKLQPFLSVIIPALNEEKYIKQLLEDLKNQTYRDFEIIVADAGSKDKTREIAKKYGAKVVKGGIPSVGRNAGAKVAKGEYFVFLDADVRLDKNFLLDVYNQIVTKDFNLMAFTSKNVLYSFEKQALTLWRRLLAKIGASGANFIGVLMRIFNRPFLGTGLICVKAKVFKESGGFNVKLTYAEDNEFIQRILTKYGDVVVYKKPILASARRFKKLRTNIGIVVLGPILLVILLFGRIFKAQDKSTQIANKAMAFFYGQMGGN